jgi:hypothetical protein
VDSPAGPTRPPAALDDGVLGAELDCVDISAATGHLLPLPEWLFPAPPAWKQLVLRPPMLPLPLPLPPPPPPPPPRDDASSPPPTSTTSSGLLRKLLLS